MTTRGRRGSGRKPSILTDEWSDLPFRLPKAMMLAFEDFLHEESRRLDTSMKKVPFIRDWLERMLVEKGYLEVEVNVDPESGHKTKSYKLKRR